MPVEHHSKWGAKIGPRLAMLMAQSVIYCHHKLVGVKHKLAMAVFHSISDEISEEVDVTLGPILRMIHDQLDETHPAYPAINFLHTNHGQLKAIVGSGLQQAGLAGSLATVINNALAPTVYGIIRSGPALLPDASVIANSYAMGETSQDEAEGAIAALGIQFGWIGRILDQAQNWPSAAELAEMYRRGEIDVPQFKIALTKAGIPSQYHDFYISFSNVPLSPADAALASLRGNMSHDDAVAKAIESGISASDFEILIGNTGEPPGLMQLLEGYRRGFIDEDTLKKGILQSRYRDEWIPLLEKLRFEPMSVADAVNAVVQNQLDMATAESIAEQNGLEPGAFQTLYATAGEPLSRTEMEDLYNRGEASRDDVIQALRESRLKNKYNDQAFDLHRKMIPATSLQRILRYGGVSLSDAVKIAMEDGYSEADATLLVNAGTAERLQTYKQATVSAVMGLYEDNIVSVTAAIELAKSMGHTGDEAKFIAQAAEFKREAKITSTAVNAIKAKYLSHHITRSQASGYIDAMGIPAIQRDIMLNIWDIEHGAFTAELTAAQIVKAFHLKLITLDDGLKRLINKGYSEGDATLLIEGA